MGSLTEQEYRLPHFWRSFVFKRLRSLPGPGPAPLLWVRCLEKRSGRMEFCSFCCARSSPSTVSLIQIRALWFTPWAWTPIVSNFLFVLLPVYCGLRKSAKSPRTKPPWLIALAGWTVIIGGLAFWTQGWYGAALDNWSHAAPALTLLQLAQRADVWEAFVAHLFTLAVLTGPIVYLLAMNRFSRRRSKFCRA